MDKPTVTDLEQMKWSEIKGKTLSGLTRQWHLKEVEIEDEHFSYAIVVQFGNNRPDDRVVITDPARKDQVRHQGFA